MSWLLPLPNSPPPLVWVPGLVPRPLVPPPCWEELDLEDEVEVEVVVCEMINSPDTSTLYVLFKSISLIVCPDLVIVNDDVLLAIHVASLSPQSSIQA